MEWALREQEKTEVLQENKSCGLQILKWGEMQPFEMVMNPKQVFLSVLIFGVAGLLLFMYLQVWIEEQHTGNTCAFSSLLIVTIIAILN